jgi:hypothetical protein
MRKITQQSAQALRNREFFNRDNTKVSFGYVNADTSEVEMEMSLHNNIIAEVKGNTLSILDAGWQTATTKERLNGVLYYFNLGHLFQKDFEWFYMDKERKVIPFNGSMDFEV